MIRKQYWRGTNRKAEYSDLNQGVEIVSKNHAEGIRESGMSVSETFSGCAFHAFDFYYIVEAEEIGKGSDGEPVVVNAKTVSELMEYSDAWEYDRELKETSEEYADLTKIITLEKKLYSVADVKKLLNEEKERLERITDKIAIKLTKRAIEKYEEALKNA